MDEGEGEITDAEEVAQLRVQARKVHIRALGMALLVTAIALGLCGAVAAFAINAKHTVTPVSDRETLKGREILLSE